MTNDLHRTTENDLYNKDASHNVTTALPADSRKSVSNKTYTNLMSLLGSYNLFWCRFSIYFVIKNRRKKVKGAETRTWTSRIKENCVENRHAIFQCLSVKIVLVLQKRKGFWLLLLTKAKLRSCFGSFVLSLQMQYNSRAFKTMHLTSTTDNVPFAALSKSSQEWK